MPEAEAALRSLAEEAAGCRRCPLYLDATRTVFGEGPAPAGLMLVGEQPGDQEDRQGHPFVGPAGQLLDRALDEAGLSRRAVYITNAVKHFKHQQQGKRRLHKRPNQGEIEICHWWLSREIDLVRPRLIVALGVTAAEILAGRRITLSRERGRPVSLADGQPGLLTAHPSAVLRMPDPEARHRAFALLVEDLRQAVRLVAD